MKKIQYVDILMEAYLQRRTGFLYPAEQCTPGIYGKSVPFVTKIQNSTKYKFCFLKSQKMKFDYGKNQQSRTPTLK